MISDIANNQKTDRVQKQALAEKRKQERADLLQWAGRAKKKSMESSSAEQGSLRHSILDSLSAKRTRDQAQAPAKPQSKKKGSYIDEISKLLEEAKKNIKK